MIKRSRELTIRKDTELVIEGFPRSGNTFAVVAFEMAQSRSVVLARHIHAPAQIVLAARRNIPTLVLIRKPIDAISSNLIWNPSISTRQCLRDYVRFYASIRQYENRYVLGKFEEVTTDFGDVIRKINERVGTEFLVFNHTRENEKACFEIIERRNRLMNCASELQVARPSRVRNELKASLRAEFDSKKLKDLVNKAEEVYREFTTSH
jgi:hypothetical protein